MSEKKIRVCDECGKEIESGLSVECEACGKELCFNCWRVATDRLCPTHYKQVKEFIEGLKGERDAKWEVHFEADVDRYRVSKPWGFRGTQYYAIEADAADALYGHMRRERNE